MLESIVGPGAWRTGSTYVPPSPGSCSSTNPGIRGPCVGQRAAFVTHYRHEGNIRALVTQSARQQDIRQHVLHALPQQSSAAGTGEAAAADVDVIDPTSDEGEGAAADTLDAGSALPQSVVRLQVVRDSPRFDLPLLLGSVRTLTCSATPIEFQGKRYLITTASNVIYSTQIRVFVGGRDKPYKARVQALIVEADLAVLEVLDAEPEKAQTSAAASATKPRRRPGLRAAAASSRSNNDAASKAEDEEEVAGAAGDEDEDDEGQVFWERVAALHLATEPEVPKLQARMVMPSLPAGQTSPVAASGAVSCVEVVTYPAASYRLLGLTVMAVTGREHVGGPVVDAQGRCAGIIFQRAKARVTRSRRGGAGDCILAAPVPVLKQVLQGVQAHGQFPGFPQLGIRFRRMDAPALRKFAKMAPSQQGVMVLSINPASSTAQVLQPGDVLLRVGGHSLGDDGTVTFEGVGRVSVTYAVSQMRVDDNTEVVVLRDGKELTLTLPLSVPHRLLPTHLGGAPPSYLVISGLVLTTASIPFMEQSFGRRSWLRAAPAKLLDLMNSMPTDVQEQAVVVAHCQDTRALDGYEPHVLEHRRVLAFRVGKGAGGPASVGPPPTRVLNLRQLARAVLGCKEGEIRLELEGGAVVVVGAEAAAADTRAVLKEYEVQSPVSADLLDLLPSSSSSKGRPGALAVGRGRQ